MTAMDREDITLPSAADGRRIHAVIRPADGEPRAVLQIAHGMMEHIGRYGAFADYLAANAENPKIFEYPQTERLVTDDGRQFFDS